MKAITSVMRSRAVGDDLGLSVRVAVRCDRRHVTGSAPVPPMRTAFTGSSGLALRTSPRSACSSNDRRISYGQPVQASRERCEADAAVEHSSARAARPAGGLPRTMPDPRVRCDASGVTRS